MNQSLYFEIVEKLFPNLVLSIAERLNEKNATTLPYMYKNMLTTDFSADGKWASVLSEYSRVAADIVSLDGELPLKSRDSIEKVSGDIPKMGLKLYLTEKQMKEIDSMVAQGYPMDMIATKIFNDTQRVIEAIYERIEDVFLSEFSTGIGLAGHSNGNGIRVDVGYYDSNKFGVSKKWAEAGATPLDDIQKMVDKSIDDQNVITDCYGDDAALTALYKSEQVRSQYAFDTGTTVVQGSTVPVLDFDKLSQIFLTKWGIRLHRVARKIKTEINGVKQNHSPWKKGTLAFACDEIIGSLVWTNVAELTRPAPQVAYQSVDKFILVSKYSLVDPLREFTSSQAMVVPIINNVDRIYIVDSESVTG